jgi:thiaminase/transcriptional activator TenA
MKTSDLKTSDLLARHAEAWQNATRHPFLDAVREGTIAPASFDAWLVQDYHFVAALLSFQARLLARTPRAAQAVLAGGLVALEAELTWFEAQARGRGLQLLAALHPVTRAYNDFLADLDAQPYASAITALWTLERAYLEAWTAVAPGASAYRPFVEHWTTPAFHAYVERLAAAADDALSGLDEGAAQVVERVFVRVSELERDFWQMAWDRR